MPRPGEHEAARLGRELGAELHADAAAISESLFGTPAPDEVTLPRAEYLRRFRALWADPAFRTREAVRLGPEQFVATARAAWQEEERTLHALDALPSLDGWPGGA